MNESSVHPWWCGAHPDYNYNTDWCDGCDDEAVSWESKNCGIEHPESIVHKREIRVPKFLGWMNDDNLWLSQKFGDAKPRLWRGYGTLDEEEADELDVDDIQNLMNDLIIIAKTLAN